MTTTSKQDTGNKVYTTQDELAETLDEMADLCERWKRRREAGQTTRGIRAGLVALCEEIADGGKSFEEMKLEVQETRRKASGIMGGHHKEALEEYANLMQGSKYEYTILAHEKDAMKDAMEFLALVADDRGNSHISHDRQEEVVRILSACIDRASPR